MKRELEYRNYHITFSTGYYWITGKEEPFKSWKEVKDKIDFWLDEELCSND